MILGQLSVIFSVSLSSITLDTNQGIPLRAETQLLLTRKRENNYHKNWYSDVKTNELVIKNYSKNCLTKPQTSA